MFTRLDRLLFNLVRPPFPPTQGAGSRPGSLAVADPGRLEGLSAADWDSTGHVYLPP